MLLGASSYNIWYFLELENKKTCKLSPKINFIDFFENVNVSDLTDPMAFKPVPVTNKPHKNF